MKPKKNKKFIFITGGVISSIGKGITAASLGSLLEARKFKISLIKCDPYINVDPGTLSPLQHGEVYVTEDGAETDLDLGHYERFTSVSITKSNSVTTGQVYESVIEKERKGEYLGRTVQVIPHITNEIKSRIFNASTPAEITIVEIGGTVGDIEGLPFIEAIRQMRADVGFENSIYIHVTYLPYLPTSGELKSKPTQHSVKELREVGIHPDFLICRSEKEIQPSIKSKISLFCSVPIENVISVKDSSSIYEVPLILNQEGFDQKIVKRLKLKNEKISLNGWKKIVSTLEFPKKEVTIGIVGKYTKLKESYKSIEEALIHGGIVNHCKVHLLYLNSKLIAETAHFIKQKKHPSLLDVDALIVPGGFGEGGSEGKISAIRYARENQMPFFGICLGMQLASIEFTRNVCDIKNATSKEFLSETNSSKNLVIDLLETQKNKVKKGGTMRLGAFPCYLKKSSKAFSIYKKSFVYERHRHRYEFNTRYTSLFEKKGMMVSGTSKDKRLTEIIELKNHPWFIGVQFHPEFKSKPLAPHPLFKSFIKAALDFKKKEENRKAFLNSKQSERENFKNKRIPFIPSIEF